MKQYSTIILLLVVACSSCTKQVYLFTSFHEPASEGLRMLYSRDAYHWNAIDTVLLQPAVGKQKIMRDPSMVQGPNGIFHLVWTTEWKGGNGIGHASSADLVHWSEQQYIPVMQQERSVVNVWAPELFYDDTRGLYIITWASTIPFKFPRGVEDEDNNHRMYYTTTKDFKTFSETKLFLDPGFSVIDAVIVQRAARDYVLVLKDNTRPERNIRVAFSTDALGPYTNISGPFTGNFTEGPTVVKVNDQWLIYFDAYQKKIYDAVATKDFINFTPVTHLVGVPPGHKHGTIVKTKKKVLKGLLEHTR